MRSVRKLLLADDSITIQKIVALTFADEGIEVRAVNNGADAIAELQEFSPDIVLADVYMPGKTGLQVCEYIKLNEHLKHIPVILLVGSFEPFDEAEARMAGAADILTKPFQSIRTLVEKVSSLLGREAANDEPAGASSDSHEMPAVAEAAGVVEFDGAQTLTDFDRTLDGAETLEFPDPDNPHVQEEPMDTAELQLTTAATRPLAAELQTDLPVPSKEGHVTEPALKEEKMETHLAGDAGPEVAEGFGEVLLDLGDFETAPVMSADDAILDIDFDSPDQLPRAAPVSDWQAAVAVEASAAPASVIEDGIAAAQTEEVAVWESEIEPAETELEDLSPVATEAETSESTGFARQTGELVTTPLSLQQLPAAESHVQEPTARTEAAVPAAGQITLEQLSPEAIDAIARRVVEQLSETVVQEIAWEVVPRLAELLIKQKLEESH